MDLKNRKIKLGELMKHKEAAALLKKSFPEWANSPLLRMASNMTLDEVIRVAGKRVPAEKIETVLKTLEAL